MRTKKKTRMRMMMMRTRMRMMTMRRMMMMMVMKRMRKRERRRRNQLIIWRKKFFRFGKETGLVYKCLKIQHSLNGLVLLSSFQEDIPSLHVYNPVTGDLINLPVPDDIIYNDCLYNNGFVVNLAYDSVMEKYKVVLCCCDGGNRIKEYLCRVITLGVEGGDPWRPVVLPKECHLPDVASWKTVFAYGSLHWLANVLGKPHLDESEVDEDAWDQREIVSFDVSSERFHTIQFPKGASEKCTTIHEMEGSLCYIDHISDNELSLWVLKKDTQQQQYEWTEKCSFHVPGILGRFWWDRGIAIVTYPRLKMIYAPAWMGDEDHADMYWNFHCYDVQSKQLETMFEQVILLSGFKHRRNICWQRIILGTWELLKLVKVKMHR
ncbi:uncharacterized protein LOC113348557 [Papaver somniferum]|uniref:uncharacterized protein LOC113348557 n=1 Tax=Papaver somniferum TaxID=3469 RepID=UPI000E6F63A6|nr:uncharacterized protein LOC113348557 [Papaver somniferum]